jgi:hypothetical protein
MSIVLAACAAGGPRYSEHVALEPDIPPHATRLTVFRGAGNAQYSGRAATVRIDGAVRGTCDYAGYQTFHATPGHHVLTVYMWDAPGTCSLSVDVLGGEEYFFEIRPRAENSAAAVLGTILGAMLPAPGSAVAPFAVMGAESAGSRCGGAFTISAVEEGAARERLKELRLSH